LQSMECTSVIPALRRYKHKDLKFNA
jgi:hypothetical protein